MKMKCIMCRTELDYTINIHTIDDHPITHASIITIDRKHERCPNGCIPNLGVIDIKPNRNIISSINSLKKSLPRYNVAQLKTFCKEQGMRGYSKMRQVGLRDLLLTPRMEVLKASILNPCDSCTKQACNEHIHPDKGSHLHPIFRDIVVECSNWIGEAERDQVEYK